MLAAMRRLPPRLLVLAPLPVALSRRNHRPLRQPWKACFQVSCAGFLVFAFFTAGYLNFGPIGSILLFLPQRAREGLVRQARPLSACTTRSNRVKLIISIRWSQSFLLVYLRQFVISQLSLALCLAHRSVVQLLQIVAASACLYPSALILPQSHHQHLQHRVVPLAVVQ